MTIIISRLKTLILVAMRRCILTEHIDHRINVPNSCDLMQSALTIATNPNDDRRHRKMAKRNTLDFISFVVRSGFSSVLCISINRMMAFGERPEQIDKTNEEIINSPRHRTIEMIMTYLQFFDFFFFVLFLFRRIEIDRRTTDSIPFRNA